jgi:LacI family transcriptional regulator/LacI family repressor for deo operon, udp, cdd, tsx, nupC, and nupG
MSSLKKVAKQAGVSIATASRVINNSENVRPNTKAKVQQAIEDLNFHPNRVAQRLRSTQRKSKLIGLVLPDIQNPFYVDVIRGVEEFAYKNNFAVMIGNFGQDEKKEKLYLEILQSEEVDGFIVAPSHGKDENIANLIDKGYSVVCIDRGLTNVDVDLVKVDNIKGAFEAIEYLIKLGHTKIAHITGHPQIPTTLERIEGYEEAMRKYDISIDKKLIMNSNSDYESGSELMKKLLELPKPPTAVFTANNLLTLGALQTIHNKGLKIPDDISIIGFDDMYWSLSLNPPLTAIKQSGCDIGKRAAEILLQRINDPQRSNMSVILNTELKIRKSCKSLQQNLNKAI